jgi:hypothetical protein
MAKAGNSLTRAVRLLRRPDGADKKGREVHPLLGRKAASYCRQSGDYWICGGSE